MRAKLVLALLAIGGVAYWLLTRKSAPAVPATSSAAPIAVPDFGAAFSDLAAGLTARDTNTSTAAPAPAADTVKPQDRPDYLANIAAAQRERASSAAPTPAATPVPPSPTSAPATTIKAQDQRNFLADIAARQRAQAQNQPWNQWRH